ncbi:MAG: 50S ribosomal protein L6 [Gammaproteobacteria bacterium WSBS_2016_MAG_OTU1]
MSRFIKKSIPVPSAVQVTMNEGGDIAVKGPAGEVRRRLHDARVSIMQDSDGGLRVACKEEGTGIAIAGTFWRILSGMISGAHEGFEIVLQLRGVGYRAQLSGDTLALQLGFSHPINYQLPAGVSAQAPTQTEIILKGADKMLVGQTAAEIRSMRPPEPYKGKGVRYRDEHVNMKETKKK